VLGRDVAGFAQTGTGKTGVFLITIAQMLLKSAAAREEGEVKSTSPQAIVIVPTRELAIQIMEEATRFFTPLNLSTLAIYGGMDWEEQASKLQRGVDLMVGTCGRLKDYYEKKFFSFDATKIFVCDEVDRMFDMGFVSDVEVFLESLPVNCQRLFFSATSNEKVKELSFEYLTKPVYISAQTDELTPTNIEQHALLCETPDKLKVLLGLWAEHKPERAIIFTNTKLTAAWLQYKLQGNGIQVDLITGDLPQAKRIALIRRIKNGEIKALIATDVASRGLHISGVSHVYNFDLPDDANNYVHRIGRTARAGAEGKSYSLVCEEYGANFLAIQELLGESAPQSSWYDPAYLQIQDKAANPFEDNFGKGIIARQPPVSSRPSREAPRFVREQGRDQGRREQGRDQGREQQGRYPRSSYQERNERQRRGHEGQDRFRGRGRDDRRPGKVVAKAAPTFGQIVKRIFNLLAFWKKKK
jgi:ATP-dependent RNA helicase RhlB